MNVTVIGAGLAGSECAWQLAQRGIQVELHEMKPEKMTPAHTTEYFAELCCSNSLRGELEQHSSAKYSVVWARVWKTPWVF